MPNTTRSEFNKSSGGGYLPEAWLRSHVLLIDGHLCTKRQSGCCAQDWCPPIIESYWHRTWITKRHLWNYLLPILHAGVQRQNAETTFGQNQRTAIPVDGIWRCACHITHWKTEWTKTTHPWFCGKIRCQDLYWVDYNLILLFLTSVPLSLAACMRSLMSVMREVPIMSLCVWRRSFRVLFTCLGIVSKTLLLRCDVHSDCSPLTPHQTQNPVWSCNHS